MAETLASVFGRLAKDIPIDEALLHRVHAYERAFVNRSTDHVQFFGGNLMGVNPLRFRTADRDDWFADVLQMDEIELRDGLAQVSAINKDWKRASDTMNHSCIWLLHAIYSSSLSPEQKHAGMVDTMLILQYKFLASLMAHYYRYPADRATMEAAYASLTYRYALKDAGSWTVLMRRRAEEIISPSGVHKLTYQRFTDDVKIINMINDIQGRLRKIVKSLTEVFYNTRAQGGRIGTSRDVLEIDGNNAIQDKNRNFTSFIRYLHSVADDQKSFIRQELVDVICDAQHTLPPNQLKEALEWMSINHREKMPRWSPKVEGAYVEAFMDEVLLHAFSLISHKNALVTVRQGLGPLLEQLRALYMASRMNDPALLKAKEMADHVVAASISSRNASVAASVRTGIQLYIVLRALTMSHYQSK